jgi:hypothetical protein
MGKQRVTEVMEVTGHTEERMEEEEEEREVITTETDITRAQENALGLVAFLLW